MVTRREDGAEVRPFESVDEYGRMIDYFLDADERFLRGMGVDPVRMPARAAWLESVLADHDAPDDRKDRLYVAWLLRGELVGHSSLSHIVPGREAHFHLHLWRPELRGRGLGSIFVARSLDLYFERYELERILSEPFAGNAAPNGLLRRMGFRFLRRHSTVPTNISLEQEVDRYEMTREAWAERSLDR